MVNEIPPILEVGGVLISSEILTEKFCCDYEKCKGICCVEGDAGAPVTMDEIAGIEDALDIVLSEARIVCLLVMMVIIACVRWRRPIVRVGLSSASLSVVLSIPFVRRISGTDL